MAVRALGSTRCLIVFSSSTSTEIFESDLSLPFALFCVSALSNGLVKRDDMLPLCLTED
jgi:hypothetical protein